MIRPLFSGYINFVLTITVALLFSVSNTSAQSEPPSTVKFDFNDVDIRSFIKITSELTGENYVIDPSVSGKITVTSPHPIAQDAVKSVFQAVLNVHGYAAVTDRGIVKIVPVNRIRQEGISIAGDSAGEGLVTRIFSLPRADADEMRGMLQPLLSRAGLISVHAASNTLIITDFAGTLDKLEKIVTSISMASPQFTSEIIQLKFSDSTSLADALTRLFMTRQAPNAPRPVFIPDPRTNSLIFYASGRERTEIRDLVVKLDVPVPEERARIRILRMKYADAEKIASILNSQVNQMLNTESQATTQDEESAFSVSADVDTNSLIVTASPEYFAAIEEVVAGLDVARPQVFVEAMIVEISSDKTHELGIEWRLTDSIEEGEWRGVGGTNLPAGGGESALMQTAKDPFNYPSGLVLGLVKGTVTFGGVEFANIAALARAMEADSGINVLSTPHLLTIDNREAEIIVGEERPFLKSSQSTDTGAIIRTYEFKDIGLTMRITPRVIEPDQIQMDIFQETKNFVAESDLGAVTTTKRQAQTSVRVPEGFTVAIGGLMREDTVKRETFVPCLGDIPLVGYLFKSRRDEKTKTNLLIFMTPHIIKDEEILRGFGEKYRHFIPETGETKQP